MLDIGMTASMGSMGCMALLGRSLRMKVRSYTEAGVVVADLRGLAW